MKLNMKKKGFTIVELVIVIAVIAVLAAVLIPTFISLTKKANKAADDSLVTSLNKALAIEEVDHDVDNMHDAVECLKREGYIASALVTKSDQKLLYSLDENRFLLEEDKNEGKYQDTPDYKFWTIQDSYDSTKQQYSIYATDDFSTATIAGLKVGFDAGDSETVESIAYVGSDVAQSVIIRTNGVGTTLEVNAPTDTVDHYDYLDELDITAVADASYHEHGTVKGKVTIAKGHIEIGKKASVTEILVKSATGNVSVTANSGTIIVVDSASASQTTVEANSENVYVSGLSNEHISGTKSSEVVKSTAINSQTTLNAAVTTGGFYYVSEAFSISSVVTVQPNKKVLIDFAGNVITYNSTWLFKNSGDLTLLDSGTNGGISCTKGALDNLGGGTLTINGGKITASDRSGSTVRNGDVRWDTGNTAKLYINDVTIVTYNNYAVWNGAYCEINGGSYTSYSSSQYGSNFGYCVSNGEADSDMVINGGNISAIHGAIGISSGNAVINKVYAITQEDSYAHYALYVAGEHGAASATINGGTFISGQRNAADIGNSNKNGDGGIGASAYVNIHGGTFKGYQNTACLKVSFSEDGFGVGQAFIDGGVFSTKPDAKYILPNCNVSQNSSGEWVVSK